MVSDTIYVGSLNPVKINAALNTLSDTLEHDFDAQGMAVASHVVVRIQEGDFMAGMQEPGTCQAGNARANDGHARYDAPPLPVVVATSGQASIPRGLWETACAAPGLRTSRQWLMDDANIITRFSGFFRSCLPRIQPWGQPFQAASFPRELPRASSYPRDGKIRDMGPFSGENTTLPRFWINSRGLVPVDAPIS